MRHIRIGFSYGLGAVALAALAWWLAPWGLVLLWPMLSLVLVACAYLFDAPGVFGKRAGRLGVPSRLAIGPYLWAQLLWRQKDWRRSDPCHRIADGLRLGRVLTEREARQQLDDGVTAVLDLTCEHDEARPFRELDGYRNIQVLDLTFPSFEAVDEGVRYIREHAHDGDVFLHCAIGYGRSAIVGVAAVMSLHPEYDVDEACAHVKELRPRAKLHPQVREHLQRYHDHLMSRRA